jgi:hypothetical protein
MYSVRDYCSALGRAERHRRLQTNMNVLGSYVGYRADFLRVTTTDDGDKNLPSKPDETKMPDAGPHAGRNWPTQRDGHAAVCRP